MSISKNKSTLILLIVLSSTIVLSSIFVPLLILPNFSNKSVIPSEQKIPSDPEKKNETLDDIPPKSQGAIIPRRTTIYNISQSEDDAWNRGGVTTPYVDYDDDTLQLGGNSDPAAAANRKICLRWNVSIPNNAYIFNAYLNLTYSTSTSYNGFTSKIYAFDDNETSDFSDVNEDIRNTRPKTSINVSWQMPSPISTNVTYQSPNISLLLQYLVNLDNWTINSFVGLYIEATDGVDAGELLEFWSYDLGNLTFTPKLIVEWEGTPALISVPEDQIIAFKSTGNYLEWICIDDNPYKYNVYNNVTGWEWLFGDIPSWPSWQSGVPIRYNLNTSRAPLNETGHYKYTIWAIDDPLTDIAGDDVVITVVPTLEVKFLQGGKEVDYFKCGDGPFTMRIYNSTPIAINLTMEAYCANYNVTLYTQTRAIPFYVRPHMSPHTKLDKGGVLTKPQYTLNYSDGYFEYTPFPDDYYSWEVYADLLESYILMYLNSIEWGILNLFIIEADRQFIYNGVPYSNKLKNLTLEVLNKDVTAPYYWEPEVEEPDESTKNFAFEIVVYDEAYGSFIDEVIFCYSIDDEPWKEVEMIPVQQNYQIGRYYALMPAPGGIFEYNIPLNDGRYYVDLPHQEEGAKIRYYIRITDLAGNSIETDEEEMTAPTFEKSPIIALVLMIIVGTLAALIAAVSIGTYYHRKKAKLTKPESKDKLKKFKESG
ncbi:MAG: hypothetical protein ACFE8A_09675 [Candidatus Hodarchaeota archaeon]